MYLAGVAVECQDGGAKLDFRQMLVGCQTLSLDDNRALAQARGYRRFASEAFEKLLPKATTRQQGARVQIDYLIGVGG